MVKLYHTAALFKHHLPSNFIRQPAQLFADALGLFVVTMHDGILKRDVSSRSIASIVLVLRSAQREGGSSLCGIAIVSTPSFLLH
jgi:hypothetical protein